MKARPLPPFPHPFLRGEYGTGAQPRTLVELEMMRLSGFIRGRPLWWEKRLKEEITSKWRKEALEQGFTKEQFDYVLAELEHYDSLRQGGLQVSAVDGVWQADDWIPQELINALKVGVSKLEAVHEHEKDWHPGTDQRTSRKTEEEARPYHKFIGSGKPGEGDLIPTILAKSRYYTKPRNPEDYSTSKTYQWLPSEFRVSKEGKVTIRSYINNLHPVWHRELYPVIAKIFELFVPLFNKVLTDLRQLEWHRISPLVDDYYEGKPKKSDYPSLEEYYEVYEEWRKTRVPIQPTPPPYNEETYPKPTREVDLKGRDLQVIVKLANIILTPDKPEYDGGVWHVEGMENEHIVASGIYYYDVENVTDSFLAFRQAVQEPPYEQNDLKAPAQLFGLPDAATLNQRLGQVLTCGGRCLAFPNILQHRVSPFSLEDRTRPGHRKILVFFLVDPARRILSTSHVPPQQSSWFADSLQKLLWEAGRLPPELTDHIVSFLDWPMKLDEAKVHREALMKERKFFIQSNTEELFERPFSLCEH